MLGNTPMVIQYEEIKSHYKDCIMFYRLGDFYEMFGTDAEKASRILGIALTSREGGLGRFPMCGVPFHSAENYIAKLIQAGLKVAICEQVEDPKAAKGIVKREVIRIVTPGTVIESNILKDTKNNYLLAIVEGNNHYALAAVDASTGEFLTCRVDTDGDLAGEILRFDPAECIVCDGKDALKEKLIRITNREDLVINTHQTYAFEGSYAAKCLRDHFKINSLVSLGIEDQHAVICACGAIIDYLTIMQKSEPGNIRALKVYALDDNMHLDYAAKRNLELVKSLHTNDKHDSLLGILDYTKTALGGRMLKNWVECPLINKDEIQKRLDTTQELVETNGLRNKIKEHLEPIYDLERIVSRISYGSANAKDLLALKNSLLLFPDINQDLAQGKSLFIRELAQQFDILEDICVLLTEAIDDEAPFSLREGGLIKDGYNQDVDELRDIMHNGKKWIVEIEIREKERSGIKNLKIGYNKVFGYYLEIPRSRSEEVPEDYVRKQTLANNERFITPELKDLENKVLGAEEKLRELEYRLFTEVREAVKGEIARILNSAEIIAKLDAINSLAISALYHNFTKPTITDEEYFVKDCRHPIVEEKLENGFFVPNDVVFDKDTQRFLIITGPNMAGKSTYCRSVALASIMMQIGSFVAASEARLPIVDRVFARIGASDDLSTGQSTFMVEMNEVSNIINNATDKSLIILDEVGRGTSTYDGLSLAWAISEYINTKIKAKTLFATHYHELTVLEEQEGIKNFSIAVKEEKGDVVFLRKIIPGGADRSYGIHVAKLAGMPKEILNYANEILHKLEKDKTEITTQGLNMKLSDVSKEDAYTSTLFTPTAAPSVVVEELAKLDILHLTPMDAMNVLFDLQKKAKEEIL